MFHVKQHSFNSANPIAFCFYKIHTVWLVYSVSLPLPREGIKGRGWISTLSTRYVHTSLRRCP